MLQIGCFASGQSDIHAGHLQGAVAGIRIPSILEDRRGLRTRGPNPEDPETRRGNRVRTRAERVVHDPDIVHSGLPYQNVEAELLMEELHQPSFRREAGSGAMRGLAELDDPGIANGLGQWRKIGEVLVRRIDASDRDRACTEIRDPLVPILGFNPTRHA